MAEVKYAEDLRQSPKSTSLRSHQLKYDGLLVFVTLIWGSTFLCGCILLGMIVGVVRVPFPKRKRFASDLLSE